MFIIDVFDVDQHGRLLADILGVRIGQNTNILAWWTFTEKCVAAGWAYTMPFHIVSHRRQRHSNRLTETELRPRDGQKTFPST